MLKVFHMDMNMVALKKDYIIRFLHKLAGMGYNAVLWELENKVEWENCPECAVPDSLSKTGFREILEVSRKLNLEPIPLLQTVGHAEYVLLHPPYWKFRENPDRHDCYCTTNAEVRKFIKNLIREYLELFGPIRFFHLGGDEAYEFGTCPACREFCAERGHNRLYSEYLLDISQPVFEKGVRPGIWPDMVLHYPDELDSIPGDFVMWDWNYWGNTVEDRRCANIWGVGMVDDAKRVPEKTLKTFPEMVENGKINPFYTADFLRRKGYEVILCGASRSAQDSNNCGRHGVHAPNIYSCAHKAAADSLAGFCVTSWAVRMHPYETQLPWIMLAPIAAGNALPGYRDALDRVSKELFGRVRREFFTAIDAIGGQTFLFNHSGHVGIQWNKLKDGTVPPDGFIASVVSALKQNAPEQWENAPAMLKDLSWKIRQGISSLYRLFAELASGGSPGLEVVEAWLMAGHMQMIQIALAQAVIRRDGGAPPAESLRNIIDTAETLFGALRPGETPGSAAWNAGLVYEALAKYLGVPANR